MSIEKLAAEVLRQEVAGDHKRAAELAVKLVEHFDAAPEPPLGTFHRDVFAARVRDELSRETHVIVGDHTPEPRRAPTACPTCSGDRYINKHANLPDEPCPTCNADRCQSGDNSLVSECKGASCKAQNRCCWQ